MRYTITLATALSSLATLLLSSSAFAEDDALRENGFGYAGDMRLELSASMLNGQRPGLMQTDAQPDPVTGLVPGPGKEDYSRTLGFLTFEYLTFFDKTRYDSLVGAEFGMALGYVSSEKADPERAEEPSKDWVGVHFKMDGAFDYALIHWEGSLAGRVVFGMGVGGEIGSYWHTEDGRLYALLVGRLQLFIGEGAGVHLSYRHLPATTSDYTVREHSLDATVALSSLHVGARYEQTSVQTPEYGKLMSRNLGAVLGIAF
jgi:hypothetical protein